MTNYNRIDPIVPTMTDPQLVADADKWLAWLAGGARKPLSGSPDYQDVIKAMPTAPDGSPSKTAISQDFEQPSQEDIMRMVQSGAMGEVIKRAKNLGSPSDDEIRNKLLPLMAKANRVANMTPEELQHAQEEYDRGQADAAWARFNAALNKDQGGA